MEQLNPQQQTDYMDAWNIAIKANAIFDQRRAAATEVASMVSNSVEKFAELDNYFDQLNKAAEVLMPPMAAFETSTPTELELFASETVWNAMSLEQKVKASEARMAIAKRFGEYGVTTESLRVVQHETEEGEKVFTLLLHTGNGVDIGDHSKSYDKARSYNGVMAKKNNDLFNFRVGVTTYDTREGMTAAVYDALVADAKAQGIPLPDSQEAAKEANDEWTWTMLTGEPLTADGNVRVRGVNDGRVDGGVARPDDGFRALRVRPAVVIE